MIAREALTSELLIPFVHEKIQDDNPNLSAIEFAKFLKNDVQDHTYAFIADILFEFIDAFVMYREGIRKNRPKLTFAALAKYAKLWSGRKHPLYRELELSFNVSLSRMPPEIRNHVEQTWSINTSGVLNTNEGPDFKLEAINKALQHWLPANPGGQDWQQCCCQHDHLVKFRTNVFSQMGISDPKLKRRNQQRWLKDEVMEFRALLRKQKYLSNPRKERQLVSLSGAQLNQDAINLLRDCREKRARYYDAYMQHEKERSVIRTTVPFQESPVFITMEEKIEYERVENKTVKELKEEIPRIISHIQDDDLREAFLDAWTQEVLGRKIRKKDLITFHNELNECLESTDDYLDSQQDD